MAKENFQLTKCKRWQKSVSKIAVLGHTTWVVDVDVAYSKDMPYVWYGFKLNFPSIKVTIKNSLTLAN